MIYIGIDPGVGGGIALIEGILIDLIKMPQTERDIWVLFDMLHCKERTAVIELVHSMPRQGVRSTFTFGRNYGFLRACLVASDTPFVEVTPRTWMKGLGIQPRAKDDTPTLWKNKLKQKAQQLFPTVRGLTLSTCDALLIAEFCRLKSR